MEQAFPKGTPKQDQMTRKKDRTTAKAKTKKLSNKKNRYYYKSKDTMRVITAKNFQLMIRLRDTGNGGHCISCGRYITWNSNCNAGHYIPGRRNALLLNEANCHSQCIHCNKVLSGNVAEYRVNLIKKVGLEKVLELESKKNDVVQIKKETFVTLNKYFLGEIKRLKKELGIR